MTVFSALFGTEVVQHHLAKAAGDLPAGAEQVLARRAGRRARSSIGVDAARGGDQLQAGGGVGADRVGGHGPVGPRAAFGSPRRHVDAVRSALGLMSSQQHSPRAAGNCSAGAHHLLARSGQVASAPSCEADELRRSPGDHLQARRAGWRRSRSRAATSCRRIRRRPRTQRPAKIRQTGRGIRPGQHHLHRGRR